MDKSAEIVKKVVKDTLEAINQEKEAIEKHQKNLKVLKADLKDLELGRLDLIRERQQLDKDAQQVSKVNLKMIHDAAFSSNTISKATQGTYVLDNGLTYFLGRGY